MAIDPRAKGSRGETEIVKLLTEATGFKWARTPQSGATQHIKGDVYIPLTEGKVSKYLIEVKLYADDQITSNILNPSVSQIEKWLEQTEREATHMASEPMLAFRKDRGKWLVALQTEFSQLNYLKFHKANYTYYIYLLSDVLPLIKHEMTK